MYVNTATGITHRVAALQLPVLLTGVGALLGICRQLSRGVLFVQAGKGEAFVGVL